jgi:hypothetical protein
MSVLLTAILLVTFAALLMGVNTITINSSCTGVVSGNGSQTFTDNLTVEASPTSILATQPAVLTVHTTGTTGTLTMTNSSHGIVTGQRLDLYWSGGQCFNAVAGTVAGTSVPIASVSGGTALPAASTPITVGIPFQTSFPVTGNNLAALVLTTPHQSYFVFDVSSTDDVEILLPEPLVNQSTAYMWGNNGTLTNPLTGFVVTSVWISHSYVTGPISTIQAVALAH